MPQAQKPRGTRPTLDDRRVIHLRCEQLLCVARVCDDRMEVGRVVAKARAFDLIVDAREQLRRRSWRLRLRHGSRRHLRRPRSGGAARPGRNGGRSRRARHRGWRQTAGARPGRNAQVRARRDAIGVLDPVGPRQLADGVAVPRRNAGQRLAREDAVLQRSAGGHGQLAFAERAVRRIAETVGRSEGRDGHAESAGRLARALRGQRRDRCHARRRFGRGGPRRGAGTCRGERDRRPGPRREDPRCEVHGREGEQEAYRCGAGRIPRASR